MLDTCDEIARQVSDAYRERGNEHFKLKQYDVAMLSYTNALTSHPDITSDYKILPNMSQCSAQVQDWKLSASAAWHCWQIHKDSPKACWRLGRALMQLGLDSAACSVIEEGLEYFPGHDDLSCLRTQVRQKQQQHRSSSPRGADDNASISWDLVAEFLPDRDVLKLTSLDFRTRQDLCSHQSCHTANVRISRDCLFSGLWKIYPSWVVSMLLGSFAHMEVAYDYFFADAKQVQDFMIAAQVVTAWASVHKGSLVAFAPYEFKPGDLRDFESKPVEEGYHCISSTTVDIGLYSTKTLLTLIDNASTSDEDGFQDGYSLQLDEDGNSYINSRLPHRRTFAVALSHGQFLTLSTDWEEVGASSSDAAQIDSGSALHGAILEGVKLPFLVAIQGEDQTSSQVIPCPCGAQAAELQTLEGVFRERCVKCGKRPDRCRDKFIQGDRVKVVVEDFQTSDEEPVHVELGVCGIVKFIDEDGDAFINFSGFEEGCWVEERKFGISLSKINPGDTGVPSDRYKWDASGPCRVFRCATCSMRATYCWLCVMDFGPSISNSFSTLYKSRRRQ